MVTNRKMKGTAKSVQLALCWGLIISMVLTLILSAGITYLVLSETMAESAVGYGVMLTVLVSSFLGAIVAAAAVKSRRLFVCLMSGVGYFLLLLSVTALFFGGQYEGMGVTALLVFGGAGAAALMGGKGDGQKRKKRRYKPVR